MQARIDADMSLSAAVFWFFIVSFLGWVWETLYCTVIERQWQSRGFLYGPLCPIYGIGAIGAVGAAASLHHTGIQPAWWHIFLVTFLGSMPLEYGIHWTLEKLFHAYWWDYSQMPLNIHGRICLPASLFFGAAGVGVYFVVLPFALRVNAMVPPLVMEVIAFAFIIILTVDITLTVSALTQFARVVSRIEKTVDERMEQLVGSIVSSAQEMAVHRTSLAESARRERLGDLSCLAREAINRVLGFRLPTMNATAASWKSLLRLTPSSSIDEDAPARDDEFSS